MEIKIVKASSIKSFYQPSTNNNFTFGKGWVIYVEGFGYLGITFGKGWVTYVEGFGYLGIFNTKKAAQQIIDTKPDWKSYRDDVWFRPVKPITYEICTVGQLREFIKEIENLDDFQMIENPYLSSGFSGFSIINNRIIAETYT